MTDVKTRVRQRREQSSSGGENQAQGQHQGQPGKQVVTFDDKIADARSMFKKMQGEFASALPKHVGVDRFMRMALTCMRKTPALLDCEPASVLGALLEAARLGLEPGTKQAAIVPFAGKATFIAQWQGLVELMYRSGQIANVTAEFIHEADQWEYTVGDGGTFWHRPNLLAEDRGEILLAYAFAEIRGGGRSRVILLNRREAEEIRDDFSKNYQRAEKNRKGAPQQFAEHPDWGKFNSTWHTHFDAMWRKSAVRRLADWVPQSPELRELLMRENEAGEMRDAADQIVPDQVFDGEVVSDSEEPPQDEPAAEESQEAGPPGASDGGQADTPGEPKPLSKPQRDKVFALLSEIGWTDRADRLRALSALTGRELTSSSELTANDASAIDVLDTISKSTDPQTLLTDVIAAARDGDHAEMTRLLSTAVGREA